VNIWILAAIAVLIVYVAHVMRLRQRLYEQGRRISRLERARTDMESVLKRRGKRLDVLFSSVNEAVLRVDRQGSVLAANVQAMQLFHPDEGLMLPQSMLIFYRDPDWQAAFSKALHILPKASSLPDMQVGEQVLVARLAPLGKKQALLLCVDMTPQARLEDQRQTFLSNLLHDLKTPLTSILGYARSIQSFADQPELQHEAAGVIATEARRVNNLLENLLTLDSIEHRSHPGPAQALLVDVCKQVCDLLSFQCDERRVSILSKIPEGQPALAMDSDDVRRILMNVLVNAVQYSPEGGDIYMQAEWVDGYCIVNIADEGPGIPDHHLQHVLERFYQVDAARGRGGHGLGLAIVKELTEAWGGNVKLENRLPQGLQVCLHIPLAKPEPE